MPANKIFETVKPLLKDESTILKFAGKGYDGISPGQEISRKEAKFEPDLDFDPGSPADFYLVIALDVDARITPVGAQTPILHWIQPDFHVERDVDGYAYLSYAWSGEIAHYIGPRPPPMSKPHRYLFLLYEQPATFDTERFAPKDDAGASISFRKQFNLEAWAEEAQLGPVVAANYFCCK